MNLNLQNTNIGPEGAENIALALKMNRSLKILNLGDNKIGDQSAGKISEALIMNSSLKTKLSKLKLTRLEPCHGDWSLLL
jgi:Ran GTPase-activating protein (RanGAP) involved in mRNA processing and transport